jgi:hypothetical protein
MLLKSSKVLRKNLRSNIKKINVKKKLMYTIEYREFLNEVKKYVE